MISNLLNAKRLGNPPEGIPSYGVLFWPILIEQLLVTFVSNVDTVLLSRFSDRAVAAVGMTLPILRICTIALFIIATGSTIILTQLSQKSHPERELSIMFSGLGFNFVLGLLIGGLLYFLGRPLLHLMQASSLTEGAFSYLYILGFSMAFQAIITSLSAYLRAYGQVNITMRVAIFVNVFNILANCLVIFTPFPYLGRGIVGVANASLLSRFLGALLIFQAFYYFLKERGLLAQIKKSFVSLFHPSFLKDVFRLGAPSTLETIFFLFTQAIITSFIAHLGPVQLASRIYTEVLCSFIFTITVALGMTSQLFVGRFLGRGMADHAFAFSKENRKGSILLIFLISIGFALLSPLLIPIFSNNPKIVHLSILTMWASVLHQPGRTNNVLSIYFLNAAGETSYPLWVSILVLSLFTVPFSYLLGLHFRLGLLSIYLVFILDEIIRSTLNWKKWTKRDWMRHDFVN